MRASTNTSPIVVAICLALSVSGLLVTASMANIMRWPPSRTGIGSKLSSPRLTLMRFIIMMYGLMPSDAASPATLNIEIGPPICDAGTCPVTSSAKLFTIVLAKTHVPSKALPAAAEMPTHRSFVGPILKEP